MNEEERRKQDYELMRKGILDRWDHIENFEAQMNMISFNMDFVICGPPGAGKSKFLEDLTAVTNIQPKYVRIHPFRACRRCYGCSETGFNILGKLPRA